MSGSPEDKRTPKTCEFAGDKLDFSTGADEADSISLQELDITSWECSRPVWEEADGNTQRCVWHTKTTEKPTKQLAETIDDGELHGAVVAETDLGSLSFPDNSGFVAADFSGATLPHADLSGANLAGANLSKPQRNDGVSETNLVWADFSDAHLLAANLSEAKLWQANFSGANLQMADLSEADLREADFSEADLRLADLSGVNWGEIRYASDMKHLDYSWRLQRANFSEEALLRIQFAQSLRGADFSETELGGACLSKADLREADFSKANLIEVDFSETNLRKADLSGVELHDPDFSRTDLNNADFSGAYLLDVDFSEAIGLRGADFSEARLERIDLSEENLREIELAGANLREIELAGANLREADLAGANLREADLAGANLREADLAGANLREADLAGANLREADLAGANLRETDLSEANLRQAILDYVGIYETSLQDVEINEGTSARPPSRWEREADEDAEAGLLDLPWLRLLRAIRRSKTDRDDLIKSEQQYRRIERLYRENDLRPSRALAVQEKHARRKRALAEGDLSGWFRRAFSRWVLGYGLLIWPILLVMAVVIAGFALLYPVFGFEDGTLADEANETGTVAYETAPLTLSPETAQTIARSVYFSAITFSTLGYGDLSPTGWARGLATVESLVGALLMAYLVSVLSRRVIR